MLRKTRRGRRSGSCLRLWTWNGGGIAGGGGGSDDKDGDGKGAGSGVDNENVNVNGAGAGARDEAPVQVIAVANLDGASDISVAEMSSSGPKTKKPLEEASKGEGAEVSLEPTPAPSSKLLGALRIHSPFTVNLPNLYLRTSKLASTTVAVANYGTVEPGVAAEAGARTGEKRKMPFTFEEEDDCNGDSHGGLEEARQQQQQQMESEAALFEQPVRIADATHTKKKKKKRGGGRGGKRQRKQTNLAIIRNDKAQQRLLCAYQDQILTWRSLEPAVYS